MSVLSFLIPWLRKERKYSFPYRFALSDFTEYAKKHGLGGDDNKEIKIIEGGVEVQNWPYTKVAVDHLKGEMPFWSIDEGKPYPDVAEGVSHNPAEINLWW